MSEDDVQKLGSIFVYSEEMSRFDFGPDHPYKPERASKTYELCTRYGVIDHPWMKTVKPEPLEPSFSIIWYITGETHPSSNNTSSIPSRIPS